MKKLTKNNLARMATLLPELNAEHQRGILGGTAVTIGTPDCTEMIPVPTVVTSTVDPYAMTESIAIPVSTAPVPTTTVSPVVSTMPVPTVTMAPVETVTVPPVPTSSTLMPTSIPVSSASTMSSVATSFWDNVCDYCTSVKDAAISLIPDAMVINVSFDFAFLGGGDYEAGYAFVFKGPDAGHIYSFDTYNFALGFHAEASLNVGAYYYTGDSNELNFVDAFGGKGAQVEADYLGGFSFGSGFEDANKESLLFISFGYGASIGGALNLGHTNVRQLR